MIPSLFSSKKADRSPVFAEDDIRKLIQSFPPPEPRPGKECLVRTLSGRNLIRSDAIVKRFKSLLENATGFIFLNGLNNELGIHDVQWILVQEDERIHYTKDRRKLLSQAIQKQIYQEVQDGLAKGGVELSNIAADKDITVATLRRILAAQNANLTLEDLENGQTYDTGFLENIRKELLETVRSTQKVVVLSDTFSQVPIEWLESTCREVIGSDGDAQGVVERDPVGLRFTPQSLLVQREGELKRAQDAYVQEAVNKLAESGYCDVSTSSRPENLRQLVEADLIQTIREAFVQENPGTTVVDLSAKSQKTSSFFLVRQETLSTNLLSIASRAEQVASEQWQSRQPGEEITFDPSKLETDSSETPALDLAIIESGDPEKQTKAAFDAKISNLQQETTDLFASTIQKDLLAPLKLYTQGADTITDTTLQPRVQDFIFDWARRDLSPETTRNIKARNLIPTKSSSRDLDKFSDAIQSSKTLEELLSAVAKLAKKQKIEQPSFDFLVAEKQEILRVKVVAMKKMKRASDLLQNVCWVLLAKGREGLYVSSGKDTSRMIKLVKEEDRKAGEKLEAWRDLVKQGKDTEEIRSEMREVAARAVEEVKAGKSVPDGEVAADEDEKPSPENAEESTI